MDRIRREIENRKIPALDTSVKYTTNFNVIYYLGQLLEWLNG